MIVGYRFTLPNLQELESRTLMVAQNKMSLTGVADWLHKNSHLI